MDIVTRITLDVLSCLNDANAKIIPEIENAARSAIAAQMKPDHGLSTNGPPEGVSLKYRCNN